MRKKFIVSVITAFAAAFALTACSGVSTVNPDRLKIDKAYKFNADINYGDFAASGGFERKEAEQWVVTLTAPPALEGVVMTYNQGEITAAFENMQSADGNSASVVRRVISAFENGVNGEGREIVSRGDELTVTSRAGNPANSYELVFNKNTLEPTSLKIAERALTAQFANVEISPVMRSFLR